MSFKKPMGWSVSKLGQKLFILGPKNKTGYSPVVLIANTHSKNTQFNYKFLKASQNQYFAGRKKFATKEGEKFIAKIPMTYQEGKNKSWYEIGYIAKKDNYRKEISRYLSCKNSLINIKSMDYSKKYRKPSNTIKKIRNSISCI